MTEFVVRLSNRPGSLARLTEVLADAGVHIEALAAWGGNDVGIVRLIVDDADVTRRTLADSGLGATEHRVLTTYIPREPGELAKVTRQLARAGVNIDALYVLNSHSEGIELAIAVDNPEDAAPHLPVHGSVETG